jgi:hypothetical protein
MLFVPRGIAIVYAKRLLNVMYKVGMSFGWNLLWWSSIGCGLSGENPWLVLVAGYPVKPRCKMERRWMYGGCAELCVPVVPIC